MAGLLVAIIIVLAVSGFCSSSEAALFSLPTSKLKELSTSKSLAAKYLVKVTENMKDSISSIVILNNIANIVGSIVIGSMAAEVFGSEWMGVFSAVLTLLVILFAEIYPKTLGFIYKEKLSLMSAAPIYFMTVAFTPLVYIVAKLTAILPDSTEAFTTNEKEIRLLASIASKEGAIQSKEAELLDKVFHLNDQVAKDIMTPRRVFTCVKGDSTITENRSVILESEHSRIIVIGEYKDEILGFILQKDLLIDMINNGEQMKIQDSKHINHDIHVVTEDEKADNLMEVLRQSNCHMAIVKDQYSGVSGIVTLEDVIEILTGEIVDETDKSADMQARV